MKFRMLVSLLLGFSLACVGREDAGAPELGIEGAWVRATSLTEGEGGPGTNSALYLTLRNSGGMADALLGGETEVAAAVEIHRSWLDGEVMRMRQVDRIELLPGETVPLEPGGYHLMLLALRQSLVEGDTIPLFLDFERSGRMDFLVPVRRFGDG